MTSFRRIDEIEPSPQIGNTGPSGWGFTLWGAADCDEGVHRQLLETLGRTYPGAQLSLPPWQDREDLVEGALIWNGSAVWVWFETALNHTWLWSANRDVASDLRKALLPIALAI